MTKKKESLDQILLTGILTERDVVRAYMRKLAKKGGSANSPKQQAHRIAIMKKINARKKASKKK